MPKKIIKIPKNKQWLFWSYDIRDLDIKKDKEYIITQVLNFGTWEDVKWLFKIYNEREVKNIVKNPGRGLWFKKVLNFWNLMFNLKTKNRVIEKAILNINPQF